MTTSLPKSYNHLALRGAGVDDMEFVEQFGLDPNVAYSDKINEAMLDNVYNANVEAGMTQDDAMKARREARKDLNELLAKNGML